MTRYLGLLSSCSGRPRKPSFTNSLKPSSVLHIDEAVLPASTRRPSHSASPSPAPLTSKTQPSALQQVTEQATFTVDDTPSSGDEAGGRASEARETGSLSSTRGILILVVVGMSQLLDNVSMTSVNLALSSISEEFGITQADEQVRLLRTASHTRCRNVPDHALLPHSG
jgi:hypothetical protein